MYILCNIMQYDTISDTNLLYVGFSLWERVSHICKYYCNWTVLNHNNAVI